MSDSLQSIGTSPAVAAPTMTLSTQMSSMMEMQYYALRAVGPTQTPAVPGGPSAVDVFGGQMRGYAGSNLDAPVTTTRMMIDMPPMPAAVPPPTMVASTGGFVDPTQVNLSGRSFGGPTPAPTAERVAPESPAAPPEEHERDIPTDYSPWREWNDIATFKDDRPKDTWAPKADRSEKFAALDNMKLTSPEEALASWRAEKERAAQSRRPQVAERPAEPARPAVDLSAGTYYNPNLGPPPTETASRPVPAAVVPPATEVVRHPGLQGNRETYRATWQAMAVPEAAPESPVLEAPLSVSPQAVGLVPGETVSPTPFVLPPRFAVSPSLDPRLLQAVETSGYAVTGTRTLDGRPGFRRVTAGAALTDRFSGFGA